MSLLLRKTRSAYSLFLGAADFVRFVFFEANVAEPSDDRSIDSGSEYRERELTAHEIGMKNVFEQMDEYATDLNTHPPDE